MLITRDDIQRIGDEETFLHFLEEKLDLPIPEGLTLEDITIKFTKFALGLSGVVASQVLDCQELIVSSGESSGIILIRFNNKSVYIEALRVVAAGLDKLRHNPANLCFMCMNEYFRPFAFAYFNDAEPGNWHAAVLKILAWPQDNTYIHTSYEHKLPISSFAEFRDEDNVIDENVLPDTPDSVDTPQDTEASLETFATAQPINRDRQQTRTEGDNLLATLQNSESQPAISPPNPIPDGKITNRLITSVSPNSLLDKLQNMGAPLKHHWNIHIGITPGRVNAFVIDERKREYLIREDANSRRVIIRIVRTPRKKRWELETAHLIWISNSLSLHKQWPWSYIEEESEAEQTFAQTYPAISEHLINYESILKSRGAGSSKGKYYWELSSREPERENYPKFYQPKIVYPLSGTSMRAAYDTSEAYILNSSYCIPTDDLSLLAILNSTLFSWYARTRFGSFTGRANLFFGKKNVEKFPIALRSENQKKEFSFIVDRILSNPNSPEVPRIEKEIDALVYELYKLTPAEIALIEEETNP